MMLSQELVTSLVLMHTILTAANELNVGFQKVHVRNREMMEAVKAYRL